MPTVTLLRDFAEDHRASMDRYADQLFHWCSSGDERVTGKAFQTREFQPQLSSWTRRLPHTANLKMRAARYLDYPGQAGELSSDIFHIIDHGYAHLLKNLDPAKVVITVHDLIPLLAGRGLIPGVPPMRRNWLSEYSTTFLKKARRLIAISHNTKNDLIEYCDCQEEQITVIHNAVDPTLKPLPVEQRAALRKEFGLPDSSTKLVLVTGQDYYKNLETSLAVMQRLEQRIDDIQLVRLGRDNKYWQSLSAAFPLKRTPITIGGLSPHVLMHLYNTVDCLLFPSWYEGFGWPPLEAMACGTPVVTSNRASLPEVMSKDARLFEPDDVAGLAGAVEQKLCNASASQTSVQQGLQRRSDFNEVAHIRQVWKVYQTMSG